MDGEPNSNSSTSAEGLSPPQKLRRSAARRFVTWLVGRPALVRRVLRHPEVAAQAKRERVFIERLLQDPAWLSALAAEPAFVNHVLRGRIAPGALAGDPRVLRKLLLDPAVQDSLVEQDDVLAQLARNAAFVQRIAAAPRFFDGLAGASLEAWVNAFATRPGAVDRLAADTAMLHTFLDLLSQRALNDCVAFFASRPGAAAALASDEAVLQGLLEELARRALDTCLAAVTAPPEAAPRLAGNRELLHRILDSRAFQLTFEQDAEMLRGFITNPRMVRNTHFFTRLLAVMEFHRAWGTLRGWVDGDRPGVHERFAQALARIETRHDVAEAILDVLMDGDTLVLADARWRVPERRSAWCLLNEILAEEEYYFDAGTDQPRILDCGMHCGLATYYFKHRYPHARVEGFEPVPYLREMAGENLACNGLEGVVVHPVALSDTDGSVTIFVPEEDSMAGSLTPRQTQDAQHGAHIEVEARRLSTYLAEPVHFLKLDVEGVEDRVLDECREHLHRVQHLFCEFHDGPGFTPGRWGQIVRLLEDHGFELRISRSWAERNLGGARPFSRFGAAMSAVIHGRNRNWNPEG